MINLLPTDSKAQLNAARTNVTLLNYVFVLGLGIVFLVLASVGVYIVMQGTKTSAEALITDNLTKTTSFSSVRAEADTLKAGLAAAKVVLDKEIRYTKTLTSIASVMPSGTVIGTLALNPSAFGSPVTLPVYARSTDDALKAKQSLEKSPLFSGVGLISLSSSAGSGSTYPWAASIGVTINKGAAK